MPLEPTDIVPDTVVYDVMRRWPATIAVFIGRGMRCIGCPVGRLHTLDDACVEHGLQRTPLMDELRAAADPARRR